MTRAEFDAEIERNYGRLLAYARNRLGEPSIPKVHTPGTRPQETRFAVEEAVNDAVVDLLTAESYTKCGTGEGEAYKFLRRAVKNRSRQIATRWVRARNRTGSLPLRSDQEWDAEAEARAGWASDCDPDGGRGQAFQGDAFDTDDQYSNRVGLPLRIPGRYSGSRRRTRLEEAFAAHHDFWSASEALYQAGRKAVAQSAREVGGLEHLAQVLRCLGASQRDSGYLPHIDLIAAAAYYVGGWSRVDLEKHDPYLHSNVRRYVGRIQSSLRDYCPTGFNLGRRSPRPRRNPQAEETAWSRRYGTEVRAEYRRACTRRNFFDWTN
jgi:hypothetical protein